MTLKHPTSSIQEFHLETKELLKLKEISINIYYSPKLTPFKINGVIFIEWNTK